jgi:hypothetical protein
MLDLKNEVSKIERLSIPFNEDKDRKNPNKTGLNGARKIFQNQ